MWSKSNENRRKQLWACTWSLGILVGRGGWGKRQAVYARWCQSDFPCRPRRNHCHGWCSSGQQRAGPLQSELWKSGLGPQMPKALRRGPFFLTGSTMSPWAAFFSIWSLAVRACPPALFGSILFLSDHLHGTQVAQDLQADGSCLKTHLCHLTSCVSWGWCLNLSEFVSVFINGNNNTYLWGWL